MNRKFTWLVAPLFLACLRFAEAQQPTKFYRIGYLSAGDTASESPKSEVFKDALHKLGYIEGQNIKIEYRFTERNLKQVALATELVQLNVKVIVVSGGDILIRVAKNAARTIPIVMTGPGSDPVEAGLIESLSRPGGNITGLTNFNRELGGKRLELLKQTVPNATEVVVLYDPATPGIKREVKDFLPHAARGLGLSLRVFEVEDVTDFKKVFAELNKHPRDGLYASGAGSFMRVNRKRIAEFSVRSRLPSVYDNIESVDAGGLMYYGADLTDSFRRVAGYVDRILREANPAEVPVERPTKFELVINLKTTKQIGLTIPPGVLARADRVIREASAKAGGR